MSSELEERFGLLQEEKEEDLQVNSLPANAVAVGFEEEPTTVDERKPGRVKKEVPRLLFALVVAGSLSYLIAYHFADQIFGEGFDPGDWQPPDETDQEITLYEGVWRSWGMYVLFTIIVLIGIYMFRFITWAIEQLPEYFQEKE